MIMRERRRLARTRSTDTEAGQEGTKKPQPNPGKPDDGMRGTKDIAVRSGSHDLTDVDANGYGSGPEVEEI